MGFTKEEADQIKAAIIEKAPTLGVCPICGNKNWRVTNEFIALTVQEDLQSIKLAGVSLPLIPITCSNCGNTHFLNLITLGLRDLVEKKGGEKVEAKVEEEKKEPKKEEKTKVE